MADNKAAAANANVVGQFKDIANDLFNIEVNTIMRKRITAQKMPALRHALLDIGKEYFNVLREMQEQFHYLKQRQGMDVEETEEDIFDVVCRELNYFPQAEIDKGLPESVALEDVYLVTDNIKDQLGGYDAFDVLRNWASRFLNDPSKEMYLEEEQIAILPRIKDNSDRIKGLFSAMCRRDDKLRPQLERDLAKEEKLTPNTVVQLSKKIALEQNNIDDNYTLTLINQLTRADLVSGEKIPPLPIRDNELVMVRKVWELGVEIIAMQTIVQVDGDVITRLNPIYLNELKRSKKLQEYHNDGVNIALSHWSELVTVAKELLVAIGRGISDRLS
ncbi:MAG: hypothetical protein GY796_13790 [Chloroflexi bacterium]|nr:hypothetical protein [Chloroflexota bacterium]